MAQINLLKQKTDTVKQWNSVAKISSMLLVVGLVVLAGYYGWLYFRVQSTNKDILSLGQYISSAQVKVAGNKDRSELLTRQQQLQTVNKLITAHVYWSNLLPSLAKVTLKKASYSSINATIDGTLALSVTLPSLTDLDKFLQVFDLPQINANFSDVRIGSYNEVPQGDTTVVKLDVKMNFNPQLLQYQSMTSSSSQDSIVTGTTIPAGVR